MADKLQWLGMTLQEMEAAFAELDEKPFRGRQMADWIYKKGAGDFAEMTSFSLALREKLALHSEVGLPEIVDLQQSARDPVWKALVSFADGQSAECVLMRYGYGNSVCLSTQVGCRMACSFCASGAQGLARNLSAGEMLGQLLLLRTLQEEMRVSHIVLMGMGEPLDNLPAVLKMMAIANASWGFGIGYRHITLSTCGLIPGIERLRQEALPINLSVSLHAPNDELRKRLMPAAAAYPLKELMAALRRYTETTHRRLTFEYGLIRDVNDAPEQAEELANLLRGMLAHVNLIPLNPVEKVNYKRSRNETVQRFAEILQERGIEATIRREMGSDIAAACGQLRQQRQAKEEEVHGASL